MSFSQAPLSDIERNMLIKTEVNETNEFRIKTELEHLHLDTDDLNVAANEISSSHNGIWLLLNKVKNSTDHKERLCEAHRFVKTSKLLLGLVTAYERNFNITPDSNTPDDTQIGSLIWYRSVLGFIGELETYVIAEVNNSADNVGLALLRLEQIIKTKKKWQEKAQYRYPHAR